MMDKWVYKHLKDVVSFVSDGDWIESRYQSDSGIRLIQTGNIGNGFFKAKEDKPHFISEDVFKNLGCTEIIEGDCIVSRLPDPIGRACIIPDIGNKMITAVDCTVLRFKSILRPQLFIYYTLSNQYKIDITKKKTGATRKRISRKNLESLLIPVPPLDEQERIVAELDLLTEVINKQKAQLKELDNLAQSIFYDMFGDPVENEKGWEVKKLGEIGKVITGSTPSTKNAENYCSNDYCFIKPSDIAKDNVSNLYNSEFHISQKGYECSRQLPHGSVLTTCIGIIGKVGIMHTVGICNQQINAIIPYDTVNSIFLAYLILGMRCVLEAISNAPVVPIINKTVFSNIEIPIPPIELQNSFASKIKHIEKQKEAITRSIAEVQQLFDYTMDKYFG